MPKSPKEMGEAIARNLPEKTGRTFEEWVELTKREGLPSRKEMAAWLRSQHQIGAVTANFIAAEAAGQSIAATYADEGALLDGMYAGDRAALRPIYDALAEAGRKLGKDVMLTVCKTYVGMRRARQFAIVKPAKTRVDLGLALPNVQPAGRLLKAGSMGNDRITHRVAITTGREIDNEVKYWLKAAYDQAG